MSYRTEQEQIEMFRQWWIKHGRLTLVAVVLALIAYAGWMQWQNHQHQRAEAASALYNDLWKFADPTEPAAVELALRLRDEYGNTFYGQASLLFLAEASVTQNDLTKAANYLDDLIRQNPGDDLAYMAKFRSAKILYALDKYEEALQRLKGPVPAGFKRLFAELRGDLYMAQKQPDKARTAYQEALVESEQEGSAQKEILEMKLSQAGGAL